MVEEGRSRIDAGCSRSAFNKLRIELSRDKKPGLLQPTEKAPMASVNRVNTI